MQDIATLETELAGDCVRLAHDFAREIVAEWKAWLTGSLPMAGIAVLSLVNPEWVRLPLWTWAILIFVAGLVAAMFRVYRNLRRQRDALHDQVAGMGVAGPFILVPYCASRVSAWTVPHVVERDHDL